MPATAAVVSLSRLRPRHRLAFKYPRTAGLPEVALENPAGRMHDEIAVIGFHEGSAPSMLLSPEGDR